jgi:hypothetical protein
VVESCFFCTPDVRVKGRVLFYGRDGESTKFTGVVFAVTGRYRLRVSSIII